MRTKVDLLIELLVKNDIIKQSEARTIERETAK